MEKIFGLGANFLEILIMKQINAKVGVHVKWHRSQDFTLAEYVAAAKRSFLANKETEKMAEEMKEMRAYGKTCKNPRCR